MLWYDFDCLNISAGETKLSNTPALGAKLVPLKSSLTAALLQSLSLPSNRKSHVVQLITLLARLNAGAAARSTFLAARSDVMRKHVRMITFEGDIRTYISDLAIVIFTGVKHTADWFLASFKENEVASCEDNHLPPSQPLLNECTFQHLWNGPECRLRNTLRCSESRYTAQMSTRRP